MWWKQLTFRVIPSGMSFFPRCLTGSYTILAKNSKCFIWRTKAELRARVGRPQTSSSPPVIFIAGHPKAALLFWFYGDFRCGALLFMVIHVIYKYKNR